MASAEKYGVDVVDLYRVINERGRDTGACFMQPSHIKKNIAEKIGFHLVNSCRKDIDNRSAALPYQSPYQVINSELFDVLEPHRIESSLLEATCFKLDKELSIGCLAGKHLVGVLHWNKACHSRIAVSSSYGQDVVELRSQYAFFEVLNAKRRIDERSVVRPAGAEEELTQKVAGKVRQTDYGYPQVIGLLVKSDADVSARVVNAHSEISNLVSEAFG